MKCASVPLVLSLLAAGCGRAPPPAVDALATDPVRLHALRAQCRRGEHDDAFCARVARADLRRFLSGRFGPDEYATLADLPPIPASFDAPVAGDEVRP